MEPERKYAAFISYRHVSPDKEIAKALQLMLEYNLVRPNKSVPRHIRPVFLDTSELPTLEDLDGGILEALDQSECLFVICSPDLPKSKYCMREISYFKEKHGGSLNQIATLLVRGDPQDAYPAILRTKEVQDPQDPSKHIQMDVEPLYADIRGKNLLHSLWKLFTSEYLRLAARYYKCSYDALKKRHKRNLIRMLILTVTAILTISGLLIGKERQVQETRANSYAAYASEQTLSDRDLSALALCTYTDCAHTEAFTAALRSAVVQRDHKLLNCPVSKEMEASYSHTELSNYYLSASGNLLVVADGNNWQVTDAHSGAQIRQFPYESAFVLGQNPQSYVVLDSRPDENGVFRDYLTVIDLESNEPAGGFAFREASPKETDYHVISLLESGYTLNMVTDWGEDVAYFTDQGQQLSKEEFTLRLLQFQQEAAESDDPYRLVKNKLTKAYVVKDAAGNELLELGSSCDIFAFSDDWKRFACVQDQVLLVYDTENWGLLGQTRLQDTPQSIHLLRNSSYCVLGFRAGGGFLGEGTLSSVMDWRTGEVFLTTEGTILLSPSDQAFYTVVGGLINRYHYTELDTTRHLQVVAHNREVCLSADDEEFLLRHTPSGEPLVRMEALQVQSDERLSCILAREPDALACYNGSGKALWSLAVAADCIAVSPDGSRCAWLDDRGTVHILKAADGSEIGQITGSQYVPAGYVRQMVVSSQGLGILGTDAALWIPETSGVPLTLGSYSEGTLFSDGTLILQNDARVNDFCVYDTIREVSYPPFSDNTGDWIYAPGSGYLVRHTESTGNNPSLYLEVWRLEKQKTVFCGQIELPEKYVDHLRVDSTGAYLSVSSGGRSRVFSLEDMTEILNAKGQLYLEADVIYSKTLYGDYQYSIPMYEADKLLELAEAALHSPVGRYTLTEEEKHLYSIS